MVISGSFLSMTPRIAVSALFFVFGLGFATWASRIPNIQELLQITDAQLGLILFAIPIGDLAATPVTAWLAAHYGTKKLTFISMLIYCTLLCSIGWVKDQWLLIAVLALFGASSNLASICVNTQSVLVQRSFKQSIMASFHGLWSLAGFVGAFLGTFMVKWAVPPSVHFLVVSSLMLLIAFGLNKNLMSDDAKHERKKSVFQWPGRSLLILGCIACGCMASEGAMFDWSGIYFKDVVKAPREWIGVGYATFMGTMATGRFLSDYFVTRFGKVAILRASGILIGTGLLLAVVWPLFGVATLGFFLVGFGVSSVVPLVYGEAGKSNKFPTSIALTLVGTIGFLGFLFGPPLIGSIAGLFSLRISFLIIAFFGASVALLAGYVGRFDERED